MLPRRYYTEFLDTLEQLSISPAVLGIDTLWEGQSPGEDDALQTALQKFIDRDISIGNKVVIGSRFDENGVVPPHNTFTDVVKYGFADINTNLTSKRVTSISPVRETAKNSGIYIEPFAFQVLRGYNPQINTPIQMPTLPEYPFGRNIILPLTQITSLDTSQSENTQEKLINTFLFPYHHIHSSAFKTLSFLDIISIDTSSPENPQAQQLKKDLHDKIVIIGYTDAQSKDRVLVSGVRDTEPGVYIHANTINSILTGNFIVVIHETWEYIAMLLLIVVLAYLNTFYTKSWNLKNMLRVSITVFVMMVVVYLLSFWTIANMKHIFIVPSRPYDILATFFFALVMFILSQYLNEDANKHLLSDALSSYVASDIVQEILTQEGKVNLS